MASQLKRLIQRKSRKLDKLDATEPHEATSTSSNTTPQLGLKIVAEGENPLVDIIAVHGLNGHRETTWTAANGKHWLRDFLPDDLPHARIMCWGYDANTHSSTGVSCQYLYDHARSLVSDLCLKRNLTKTMTRPIIFVAHSLGGIIVKSALIHSNNAGEKALAEHRSIMLSTYGIIFMGTPHQGGNGVVLGKLMVNIASVFIAADNRLLQHLERDSEWLQQQLGQYGPISDRFVTKFAYEEYRTKTVLGQSIMVVPRASAVVPGAADAEPIVIHADHVNMVRFASKDDGGYQTVSGHLQIMTRSTTEPISARWEEERRMTEARANTDPFSIVFSLSTASETSAFVGRGTELAEIHSMLRSEGDRRTVVLHGLGGIGKTQLAIEYARRHRADYSAVFWLNAKDEDSLKQSFAAIARQILREHPAANRLSTVDLTSNLDEVVSAVQRWLSLSGNTRWLMIFDNYDNPKVAGNTDTGAFALRPLFPQAHQGCILITTRSAQVKLGHRIRIQKLKDVSENLAILAHASRRDNARSDPDAMTLAKRLDGLPLALATAGAYLDGVSTSFSDYLRDYEQSWLQLQQSSPEVESYQDRTLYTTWDISYRRIEQQNMLSAKVLQLWAYFDNQDLWYEVLHHDFAGSPNWFSALVNDNLSFVEAMRVLDHHGLVSAESLSGQQVESAGYSIHACVHSWSIHVLNRQWNSNLAKIALRCLGSHVPKSKAQNGWITERRIMQHAVTCSRMIHNGQIEVDGMEWALHQFGLLFLRQDKMEEAEKLLRHALQGKEEALGLGHESTLNTVICLGKLYMDQDKLAEAEKMHKRALNGYEKLGEPDHPTALHAVNNLAVLYKTQGKLAEAEEMFQRALHGKEKELGPDHTSTLTTVGNLGDLYKGQGRLVEAEKLLQRALQGAEEARGPYHPSTLRAVHSLGSLYSVQGKLQQSKLQEAERMYQRAYEGFDEALGPDHTSTLAAFGDLAMLYHAQGKLADAEEMFQRVLQGLEKVFGPDHAWPLKNAQDLARTYYDQCYAAHQKATDRSSDVHSSSTTAYNILAHTVKMVDLCAKYPSSMRATGVDMCRVFFWAGRDDLATVVSSYALSDPQTMGTLGCDGCRRVLSVDTGRWTCRSCKDVDLCSPCGQKHNLGGPRSENALESCRDHQFLELSPPGSTMGEERQTQNFHRWIQELANRLRDKNLSTVSIPAI